MDMKRLGEEIDQCRDLGFAQDIGEVTAGINMISAPVFGLRERVVGCITLVGTFSECVIAQYGPRVASMARQISYKLGAPMKNVKGIELQCIDRGTIVLLLALFSPKNNDRKRRVKVAYKIWLDNHGKAFGEGPHELLKRVEKQIRCTRLPTKWACPTARPGN